MATFQSIQAFQREVETLSRTMNRELRNATREMAENAERVSIQEARSDLGGDTQFSGWPRRDLADLVVKRGRRTGVNDTAHWLFPTRKAGGPWKVAEQGRNQGDVRGRGGSQIFIGPSIDKSTGETFRTKTGKVRMTRRRRTAKWSGYTKGKRTASNAAAKFERDSERIAEKRFRSALEKHFDVS